MKILYAGYSLLSPIGGGEISAFYLLQELAKKHKVIIVGLGSQKEKYFIENNSKIEFYEKRIPNFFGKRIMPLYLRKLLIEEYFRILLRKTFKKVDPELIILQSPAIFPKDYRKKNRKIIFFIRSLDWYGLSSKGQKNSIKKIYNYPFIKIRSKKNKRILREADLVFTNSYFMQRVLLEKGIKTEVVYPFLKMEEYKILFREPCTSYVTFVTPNFPKGREVVLRIVEKLPEEKFLFVGIKNFSLDKKIENFKNITVLPWIQDMKEVYRKTKIIIMPSVWEEPFGRVPIEAGINGIPTIASKRGGLPESVGEGGILIDDIWNINNWVSAIKRLENPAEYKRFSKKAVENAKKFDFKNTFANFKKIVKERLNINL